MSLFLFDQAFRAEYGEVSWSPAEPGTVELRSMDSDASHRLELAGLHPSDFAVFGYLVEDGKKELHSYLVTDYSSRKVATAINSDHVQIFPEKYVTPRLERLLRRVGREELSQFGIEPLIDHLSIDK